MNEKQRIDSNDVKEQIHRLRSLNESVDRNTVASAIQNRDVVYIYYAGDETINKGYRTIEPFCLGVSTAGNMVLRAWQQAGATDSGTPPVARSNDQIAGWRLFRLDGITSMNRTLRRFDAPRPGYNPQDKQMTQVIAAAQFGNTQQPAVQQPQQQTGVTPNAPTTGTTPTVAPNTYQGMTNDKSWFQNQVSKFRTGIFGNKNEPKPVNNVPTTNTAQPATPTQDNSNAARNWLGQKKRDFDNIIRKSKTTQDNNGRI